MQVFVAQVPKGIALLHNVGGGDQGRKAEGDCRTLEKIHIEPCNPLKENELTINNLIFSLPAGRIFLDKMGNIAPILGRNALDGALDGTI